jgi:hypothetical protein
VNDDYVRIEGPLVHFTELVHNQNTVAIQLDTMGRFVKLHAQSLACFSAKTFTVAVVPTEDASDSQVMIKERLQREWRTVISCM